MVSLWPWKRDNSSPASFERVLSSLSRRISKKTASLDSLRQTSRRIKALWTLYTSFAYILYTIILFFIEGWRNWGPVQYTSVAGAPVVIYLVRLLVDTFYNYRISKISAQLEQLHKEREKTIDKLKAATKYNSTQQLLDKYGGGSPQSPSASSSSTKRKSGRGKESPGVPKGPQQRTHILPPPTANVPRNNLPPNVPSTPQSQSKDTKNAIAQQNNSPSLDSARSTPNQRRPGSQPDSPGFAPNAYAVPPQYSSTTDLSQPHWYDRVLDLLLGEDETLPKNRYALICKECRLVNGQAPPGTKSLEDIGRWRCASCGAWNGDQAETTKLLDEMKERAKSEVETQKAVSKSEAPPSPVESNEDVVAPPASEDVISEVDTRREDTEEDVSDQGQEAAQDEEEKEDAGEEEKEPTPKAKRGRPKGSGKKKKG